MDTVPALVGTGPDVTRMSEIVQDHWIAFIGGADPWSASEDDRPITMLLGAESHVVENHRREQLSVWDGRYPAAG
jgi:para-nitrobenzyl esterase